MSTKKQGGKLIQHKRPQPKFLGLKVADGQKVSSGEILVKQRGTEFKPGIGVKAGRDHSLYSIKEGKVKFLHKEGRKMISIVS